MLLQHPELLVTDEEREEVSIDALAAEEKKTAQSKQAAGAVAIVAGDNSRISSSVATAEQKSNRDGGEDTAESSEKSILRLSRSFSTSMQTNPTSDEDMVADEVEDEGVLNESADGGKDDEEEGRNDDRSVGSEDSDTAWMRDN
jgi:hypothetical protein